jgi:hypothetical protein
VISSIASFKSQSHASFPSDEIESSRRISSGKKQANGLGNFEMKLQTTS